MAENACKRGAALAAKQMTATVRAPHAVAQDLQAPAMCSALWHMSNGMNRYSDSPM